ncbi:MAG: hypothetical protein ACI82Q_001995 [Nonlabens sp.]|jgi:hypothetical protein
MEKSFREILQKWKRTLTFSFVGLLVTLLFTHAYAQELPRNLLYANENLRFEKLYKIGDYKVLHIAPVFKQNQRYMYLLDEANIVVDTMKVDGSDYVLMRSDSTFSIKSLGDLFEIKIVNGKFQTQQAIDVSAVFFSSKRLDPYYLLNRYFIGAFYHVTEDHLSYHYLSADSLELLSGTPIENEKYNIDAATSVYLLNEKEYTKLTGKTYENLPISPLFDKQKTVEQRIKYPFYGWLNSSFHSDRYTFYEKNTAKIFTIDVSDEPKLVNEIALPIADKDKEGWKYLFDFKVKKHYAIKRIDKTEIPEGMNKRKAEKIEKNYEYQLYQLMPKASTFELKPLYKLGFDPVLIDDDLIYEIVQESKTGSAIFFHPLDTNYVYQKRKSIYSGNE